MLMTMTKRACGLVRKPLATALLARLRAMVAVARQRRQLAQLSDAQLKDIGISRADAEREVTQPFWRL